MDEHQERDDKTQRWWPFKGSNSVPPRVNEDSNLDTTAHTPHAHQRQDLDDQIVYPPSPFLSSASLEVDNSIFDLNLTSYGYAQVMSPDPHKAAQAPAVPMPSSFVAVNQTIPVKKAPAPGPTTSKSNEVTMKPHTPQSKLPGGQHESKVGDPSGGGGAVTRSTRKNLQPGVNTSLFQQDDLDEIMAYYEGLEKTTQEWLEMKSVSPRERLAMLVQIRDEAEGLRTMWMKTELKAAFEYFVRAALLTLKIAAAAESANTKAKLVVADQHWHRIAEEILLWTTIERVALR